MYRLELIDVYMENDPYFVVQYFEFVDLHLLLVMLDVDCEYAEKVIVYEILYLVG
jgi:hypothetical protein